ncbi:MAG: T9SS type A sorting domain-containing protein [Bacteroidia bacterium]
MNKLVRFWLLILLFINYECVAQVPFSIEIEPIAAQNLPGLHSFAFAQSGSKWLFVGGRTNGLHGFSTNDNFNIEQANDLVTVFDTSTWMVYVSPLNILPPAIADPLRSTNMQYAHIGDYLYMFGGFGWDSTINRFRTFDVVSAIHVDNTIAAVMNATSLTPHIRQFVDTNFQICGGELLVVNNECVLFFGHNFGGRYSDPPQPTFTQTYSHHVKRFTIADDGITISIQNLTQQTDTNIFHRRDLNVGPVVHPDGSFGAVAYSGVFRKTVNWPHLYPITFNSQTGAQIDSTFEQKTNNYTCGLLPIFDSVQGTMFTVLFGGMGLFYNDTNTNQFVFDSLVPFIGDISVVVHDAQNTWTQVIMPIRMPALQGSNMKFVPVSDAPHYTNEVVKLREVNGRILAGYLVGGITASGLNNMPSVANDTVYRVYLTPNNVLLGNPEVRNNTWKIFPDPATDLVYIKPINTVTGNIRIELIDMRGAIVRQKQTSAAQVSGLTISVQDLPAGEYIIRIITEKEIQSQPLRVVH